MKKIITLLLCLLLCAASFAVLADEPTEKTQQALTSYSVDTFTAEVTMHQWTYKKHQLVFYVAHVTLSDPQQMRTAFARDTYHKSYTEDTLSIAERAGALLAVNGDYYNHNNKVGVVLRNGELFRNLRSNRDLLWIGQDGALNILLKGERDGEMGDALLAQGAVQTFEFGPALVRDGELLDFPETYFISTDKDIREPRTAIGWIDDLHYVFVVADGRRTGWSDKGMSLQELQQVMYDEGCLVAYNLDGGGSSTLYLNGEILNQPSGGSQRKVSDILLITP